MTENEINYIQLPYYYDLEKIYIFMKTQNNVDFSYKFPHSLCDHTSRLVSEITGLEIITGQFEKSKKEERYPHTLNLDKERGLYIDLTRGQFGFKYDGVVIEPVKQSLYFPYSKGISDRKIKDTTQAISPKLEELFKAYENYFN